MITKPGSSENTVTSLELLTYVTYNATEEELQTYGPDTPNLSVTVNDTYTNDEDETVSDTFIFHISENPGERAAAEAAVTALCLVLPVDLVSRGWMRITGIYCSPR